MTRFATTATRRESLAGGLAWRINCALAGGVLLVLAAGSGCTDCEEGGRAHDDGDIWTCSDGCNTCTCNGSTVSQTLMLCTAEKPGPAAGTLMCRDAEGIHQHGQIWTCADGCDECTCDDGHVERTAMECEAAGNGGD